jgi:hypothetical protein
MGSAARARAAERHCNHTRDLDQPFGEFAPGSHSIRSRAPPRPSGLAPRRSEAPVVRRAAPDRVRQHAKVLAQLAGVNQTPEPAARVRVTEIMEGIREPGVGTRLGMGAVAELVCQACGAVSHSKVPKFRPDTMPACPCGGRRQIVRIRHHGRFQEPTSEEESG